MRSRTLWIIGSILAGMFGLIGCRRGAPAEIGGLQAVTTLFPLYDFCRQLAQDQAHVTLLLPPGVEPHGFEPRPGDILRINKADLFVYTGPSMEPWVQGILGGLSGNQPTVVDASAHIPLLTEEEEGRFVEMADDSAGRRAAGDAGQRDPHIWLDPLLAQEIVRTLAEAFAQRDPAHQDLYRSRAAAYNERLAALDAQIRATLARCKTTTIVVGGHFAFGYFAKRYGLHVICPYEGFSPDAEPTPRSVAQVLKALKKAGTHAVYFEEMLEPRLARMMAESTGATLLLLDGAHNVSRKDLERGVTYLEIMEGNLERLKQGLGCEP